MAHILVLRTALGHPLPGVAHDADAVGCSVPSDVGERGGSIHRFKVAPTCRNGKSPKESAPAMGCAWPPGPVVVGCQVRPSRALDEEAEEAAEGE